MGGDQAHVADRHAGPLGDHPVRLGRGLEPLHLVRRIDRLEQLAQAAAAHLRLGHSDRAVRERDQPVVAAKPLQRGADLRVRRQGPHALEDRGRALGGELDLLSLREHGQGIALRGAEIDIRAGEPADEGQLEHEREPLGTERGVAERGGERRVERAQIEQRLVDVEGENGHSAERGGFEPPRLSPTRFPGERTRPLCDLSQ